MRLTQRLGIVTIIVAALTMTIGVASAGASAFVASEGEYPGTLKSTGNLEVTLKTDTSLGELSMDCILPGFEKTINQAQRTLTTTGEDGLCTTFKGTQTTLAMNGCKFILEPGAETAEGEFEGYVSPDTSCTGKKIVADFAFGSCAKFEYTPNSYTAAESTSENKGSYPNKSIAFGMTLEGLDWKNSCGSPGSSGSLDVAWEMTQGEGEIEVAGISPANTVMCKESAAVCPLSSRFQTNSSFTPSTGKANILINIYGFKLGIRCNASALPVFAGPVAANGALPTTYSNWILAECTNAGESCTVTTVNLPYKGELSSAGTLTVKSSGAGAPGWHVSCLESGWNCTYAFEPTLDVEGNTIVSKEEALTATPPKESGFCPGSNPTFIATYGSSRYVSTDE